MGAGEENTVKGVGSRGMPGSQLAYSEAKLVGTKALARTRNCTSETLK